MSDWHFPYGKLSEREDEIFALIARGRTLRQIARRWHVRYTTVRTLYARACMKLGANSQGHAMARWKDHEHARQQLGLCMTTPRSRRRTARAQSRPCQKKCRSHGTGPTR